MGSREVVGPEGWSILGRPVVERDGITVGLVVDSRLGVDLTDG